MNEIKKEYLEIRNNIDKATTKLEEEHKSHMKCKAGCDMCCMDYSILPVEFYYIKDKISKSEIPPGNVKHKKDTDCVFLKDHRCSIYNERPVICRTHGLPLLFMTEHNWELSACELNFTEFNFEEFNETNTYPQDRFNSQLFMLNKKFISRFDETKYGDFDLIPVRDLLKYFN